MVVVVVVGGVRWNSLDVSIMVLQRTSYNIWNLFLWNGKRVLWGGSIRGERHFVINYILLNLYFSSFSLYTYVIIYLFLVNFYSFSMIKEISCQTTQQRNELLQNNYLNIKLRERVQRDQEMRECSSMGENTMYI